MTGAHADGIALALPLQNYHALSLAFLASARRGTA